MAATSNKHVASLVVGAGSVASVMYAGMSNTFVSVAPTGSAPLQRQATHASGLRGSTAPPAQSTSQFSVGGTVGALFGAAALAQATRRVNQSGPRRVALAAFESDVGAQAPLGFFDPAGFCLDGDAATYRQNRLAELKHGRVAMIAAIGYITPEFFRFPGMLSPHFGVNFADVPNGLQALNKVPFAGLVQWFVFVGVMDTAFLKDDKSRAPGDSVRVGSLGAPNAAAKLPEGEGRNRKLNSELANGRLAMMAIIGMFFQDGLTGAAWGDWSLYTASPLRAAATSTASKAFDPSAEPGAIAPLGYWDPAGLAMDHDEAEFRRFRACEIKHGRSAMLATVGLIGQHWLHFPGFENIPKGGLNAMTTYPGSVGLAFIFIAAGFFELTTSDEGREAGNFGDPGAFQKGGVFKYDNQWRNMEIQNGRLAMIGFMGTICAEYATGKDALAQWDGASPAAIDFIKRTLPFAP